jgi:hypothetical protein
MLAGLWGANNYQDLPMANRVRTALLGVPPNLYKFYDQRILHYKVFPLVCLLPQPCLDPLSLRCGTMRRYTTAITAG